MKRWGAGLALLLGVQLLLLGVWWAIERGRSPEVNPPVAASLVTVDAAAPDLRFKRVQGPAGALSEHQGLVVVHFWATWCAPCLEELPALLAWAESTEVSVLAVSVDPSWSEVEDFFGGRVPAPVVRADAEVARTWGAHTLPMTFIVRSGRLEQEGRGALDWSTIEL